MKKRTAEYEKEYADHKQQLIDLRREAKLGGNFFVEPEAKLLFVIRIVGIIKLAPKPRKVLQLLRLRHRLCLCEWGPTATLTPLRISSTCAHESNVGVWEVIAPEGSEDELGLGHGTRRRPRPFGLIVAPTSPTPPRRPCGSGLPRSLVAPLAGGLIA